MSFDLILPFLRPIASLIEDPDISEIMVNGSGDIFTEKRGQIECHPDIVITQQNLTVAVKTIARLLGDDISDDKPILDSRLPDGSRVAAVLPPCSVGGITLTIRKFHSHRWTLDELVHTGAITHDTVQAITTAIGDHRNILISGGTGTGKTTMLNALAGLIPPDERLVVIEDTAEIQIKAQNLVRFEARRAQEKLPAVTIRDLLKATLRHRPDRIILGEIRGEEAFDLLQALNTGHSGTLSTIHANNARQALSRFSSCVLQAKVDLPFTALQTLIADAVHFVLHIERRHARRYVAELLAIDGYDVHTDTYRTHHIYPRPEPHPHTLADLSSLSQATLEPVDPDAVRQTGLSSLRNASSAFAFPSSSVQLPTDPWNAICSTTSKAPPTT